MTPFLHSNQFLKFYNPTGEDDDDKIKNFKFIVKF